jgi:RNA polymerase sigma-70 factor, ECF subfamily
VLLPQQCPRSLSKQFSVGAAFAVEGRSDEHAMKLDPAIRDQVLANVPPLRAFAISLCANIDRADDLVQETLLLALTHIDSFEPGTNMPAWLFTILRNLFRSEYRKRRREVEDADGRYAETLKFHPEQTGRVEFEELCTALAKLPAEQREALILVGASGFTYDDAAAICGCVAGTIKSRVNRARARLAALLAINSVDDFGPDRTTRAVLAGDKQSAPRGFI